MDEVHAQGPEPGNTNKYLCNVKTNKTSLTRSSSETSLSSQSDTRQRSTYNALIHSDDFLDSNSVSTTSGHFSISSGNESIQSFNSDFSRSSGISSIRSSNSNSRPPLVTHGSRMQDEGRSKTIDTRFYPNSFHDPGQSQKSILCSRKDADERYYTGSSYHVNQSKQQPVPTCPPISTNSDEGATHDIIHNDAAGDEPTTEGSSQSTDSDESGSVSSADDEKLTMAYTKCQIISSLMRDVYALFSSQWQANMRTRTTPEAESSRVLEDSCESTNCSKRSRLGKRANYGRDRSQGDGNDGKKQKNSSTDIKSCELDLKLACPFYKYDPTRYGPNIDTGVRYRTCSGPGFSSISRLKQHLRRTHVAPKQCRRCWLVYKSQGEEDRHVNADPRCEARPIHIEEGISEEKMLLINSKRGATWGDIFKIMFPGAPVPSPYHEPSPLVFQTAHSSSSQSSDPQCFEAYNRTTLRLVEERLRGVLDDEVAPIEERVRTIVVDVVRDSLATAARNLELPNSQSGTIRVPRQASPYAARLPQIVEERSSGREEGSGGGVDTHWPNCFLEPQHLNEGINTSVPVASSYPPDQDTTLARTSDCAYGPYSNSCECSCHFTSGLSSTLYDGPCGKCGDNHFDPLFPDDEDLANLWHGGIGHQS